MSEVGASPTLTRNRMPRARRAGPLDLLNVSLTFVGWGKGPKDYAIPQPKAGDFWSLQDSLAGG